MKTITIKIEKGEATIVTSDTIDRNDFKIILKGLIDTFGNQPGIKKVKKVKEVGKTI